MVHLICRTQFVDKHKMKSIVLALTLAASATHAFEISKSQGRLRLSGPCDEGTTIVHSLAQWSRNAQTGKVCDAKPTSTPSGQCDLDITNCVPDHVVTYHGANPAVSGPNCWNLSLVMSKILPALRYSAPEEMNFYMRPPLCRQLKDGEKKEPGDVGAIRQIVGLAKTEEYHGFVYISDKIAYSKNGFSSQSPYELQTLDKVYDAYEVPDKDSCRKNEITGASAQCGQAVSFFRCDSMETYLQKNSEVPEQIRSTFEKLDKAEDCVQQSALSGRPFSEEAQKNLRDTSVALLKYLEDAKESPALKRMPKDERDFLLGSLQLRLSGIADQFEIMYADLQDESYYQYFYELQHFAHQLERSRSSLKGAR